MDVPDLNWREEKEKTVFTKSATVDDHDTQHIREVVRINKRTRRCESPTHMYTVVGCKLATQAADGKQAKGPKESRGSVQHA